MSCEYPISLPIPPSDPILLVEAAIVTVRRDVSDKQPVSRIGELPEADARDAGKTSSGPAPSPLASLTVLEAGHTPGGTSTVAESAGRKPTGDLTSLEHEVASSTVAIEASTDIEMTEANPSSSTLVWHTSDAQPSKPRPSLDESAGPRPELPALLVALDTGSVAGSSEQPIEPVFGAGPARVGSGPEPSHPAVGGLAALPTDDLIMDDAEPEDDDSPSSSRTVSPAPGDEPLLPDGVIMERTMLVEVEVRVSEDKSNRFIPGHRIIVRFRLVV